MTTIENVYCRPQTADEWASMKVTYPLDRDRNMLVVWHDGLTWQTNIPVGRDGGEIPVSKFLELLADRIAGWRLLQIGFKLIDYRRIPYYEYQPSTRIKINWSEEAASMGIGFELPNDDAWLNVHTFTELLTLIKFLTPKT